MNSFCVQGLFNFRIVGTHSRSRPDPLAEQRFPWSGLISRALPVDRAYTVAMSLEAFWLVSALLLCGSRGLAAQDSNNQDGSSSPPTYILSFAQVIQ
jgi:hypothetical protein